MIAQDEKTYWHSLAAEEVLSRLKANAETGMPPAEVTLRLATYGPNVLSREQKTTFWRMLLRQFESVLVILLLAAMGISVFLGALSEALTILVVVLVNGVIGVLSESKAEKAVEALRKMTSPSARVLREGREQIISAEGLVPGDILVLKEGDVVPADARLVTCDNLQTQEGMLTGESVSIWKQAESVPQEEVPVGDRTSLAFMGTNVTRGTARAVVYATGQQTQMGEISHLMEQTAGRQTPLEKDLNHLGHVLVYIAMGAAGLVAVTGILKGFGIMETLLAGVSLAIAAVPEGLPAVVTIAMAFGMARMARQRALIRRLPSVETLGCTTVICVDKTGTLTKNEMTVKEIRMAGETFQVEGQGYEPTGGILCESSSTNAVGAPPVASGAWSHLMAVCQYCNDANLFQDQGDWQVAGDPTEGALLVLARKGESLLAIQGTRVKEFPFDSMRKMMSSVLKTDGDGNLLVLTKGATDSLLDLCAFEAVGDKIVPFDTERRDRVGSEMLTMAERGLRVLGLAYKETRDIPDTIQNAESDLIFLGLVGLVDPANEAIRSEIDACHRAGVQVKMLTGDHRTTAQAIGAFLGLATEGEEHVIEGKDFETFEGDNLDSLINKATVFSRVAPETKLRIVEALQKSGHVVAMTGDGVNDGPALMRSDIGIAMGKRGTEVAKQAADMILQDDDFSSIVAAIREGRVIYANITKFIHYLFACNISEILIVFLGTLFSKVLPLFPLQILWVNFVTDVFPALALSQEKADADVMVQPPRPPKEKLVNRAMLITVFWQGLLLTGLCLGVLFWALGKDNKPDNYAQTMTFTAMVMMQLGHLFHCRNPRRSVFRQSLTSNWFILFAVVSSALLQLMVLYVPFFQEIFRTVPLRLSDWEIIFSLVAARVLVNEVVGLVKRHWTS